MDEQKPENLSTEDLQKKFDELQRRLEICEKEQDEYLNGWKRSKADLINYQKDETKRFQEMIKYSTELLVRDLIAVLDSFELGISAMEKSGGVDKGVYIIKNQLEDILRKQGLEKIKVVAGEVFDPSRHESVGEAESTEKSGTISEEVESGYLLNGKVVRPVRIKLSK